MLGKLLKHEWKATWKLPLIICLSSIIMCAIACTSIWLTGHNISENPGTILVFTYITIILFMVNAIVIAAAGILMIIYFAYRFYKNLFKEEGYLTNTLPVKPAVLILSKGICAFFWILFNTIITVISCICMFFVSIDTVLVATGESSLSELLNELQTYIPDINHAIETYTGIPVAVIILILVLILLAGCVSSFMLPYLCLSLGQLFKKHRVAAAVGFYFAASFIIQIIVSIISIPFTVGNIFRFADSYNSTEQFMASGLSMMPTYIISLLISVTVSVVAFFITKYILGKKLNLE